MAALTSCSVVTPSRRKATSISLLVLLCACLLILDCVVAECTSRGISSEFTTFGEQCAGDGCQFDDQKVGRDLSSFCLTTASDGGHPVQLVRPADNHLGLQVVDEGVQLLRTFPKPLAIIAAIGSIKTGKSSFMNVLNEHVLCGKGDLLGGFHVDDTVSATTRGIWMWSEPIEVDYNDLKARINVEDNGKTFGEHLTTIVDFLLGGTLKATLTTQERIDISKCKNDKVNVVLLDVEGFNSIGGFQRYDEALFTIVSALSTELIYITHNVIDSRDIMDLQNMVQMANMTILNINKALAKAPQVIMKENNGANETNEISLVHQLESTTIVNREKASSVAPSDPNILSKEMIQQLQRNTGLTILVQGFNLQLQESALNYVNQVVNGKRFDLSYADRVSFFEYIEKFRAQLMSFFRGDTNCKNKKGCPEHMMNDVLERATSGYQYVLPHVFRSIDVLLTSTVPKAKSAAQIKANLIRGYLEQIRKYKTRAFKRCLMQPKQRYSPVMNSMTLMNGDDLGDMLIHLVKSIDKSLKSGSTDYLNDIRTTRANLVKRDLVDLYAGELWEFVHNMPIPLVEELERFSENTKNKYTQKLTLYAQYDLKLEHFENLRVDFEKLMRTSVDHFRSMLHKITETYCQSKVPAVKKSIRERIGQFKLPVVPAIIKQLDENKDELMALYVEAIDENAIKYSNSAACKDISKEVSNYITDVIEELNKENDNEISMLFQEATRRSVEFFISNADRNAVEKYKVNHKEFLETLDSWISGAYSVFYEEVGEFKTLDKFSNAPLAFLKKQISLFDKEARDHWNDVCEEVVMNISHKVKSTFKTQLMKLLPYRPVPSALLSLAIEYLRASGLHEMEELYCGAANVVREAQKKFNVMVDESRNRAMRENYETIFKHLNTDFQILHEEALRRIDNVYHFYQLKKHIHFYAEWHVFQNATAFERLFKPKRNLEELTKNVDIELLKKIPENNRISRILLAIQQPGDVKATKLMGMDLNTLRQDIVEQWLETKLYPIVRPRLMVRMPMLSTFLAMMGFVASSLLIFNVQDSRALHFLYCLNAVTVVWIAGPRRALVLLSMIARWTWLLLTMGIENAGLIWAYVICSSVVGGAALWYLLMHRLPAALYPWRAKSGWKKSA